MRCIQNTSYAVSKKIYSKNILEDDKRGPYSMDDPKTFDKAMKCQDVAFWKEAINNEINSIMGNNTWVDLTKEFLSSKFSMKNMKDVDVILVSTPMDISEKMIPNNGQASTYKTKVRSKKQKSDTVEPAWAVPSRKGNRPLLSRELATVHEGRGGGGLVVLGGKSLRKSKNGCREVGGVENISSTGYKFMANGEDCLDGCDGGGGGEVKGGGVDFGVLKSSSDEAPSETMGEIGGNMMGLGGGSNCIKPEKDNLDLDEIVSDILKCSGMVNDQPPWPHNTLRSLMKAYTLLVSIAQLFTQAILLSMVSP
ncbi:hypothetical protein Tco_1123751 [Tanacetum coccineum]|uniref:Myb/SANT-like domain-containing protein n=1 Tax=Tanacetum coccineum TaxID=301880 RepID=A0ABQ5J4T8_9ASTR